MKYNCTITNDDALPIPYAAKVGPTIIAENLYKDHPLFLNVQFITGTARGQIELRCTEHTIIIKPTVNLTIKFVGEQEQPK